LSGNNDLVVRIKNYSKIISFGSVAVLILMMMAATVIEKLESSDSAFSLVYHSPLFITLWLVAVLSGLVWIWKAGLPKKPIKLFLHLSFVIILAGALTSHLFSTSGLLRLRIGESSNTFICEDGTAKQLPFNVSLKNFDVQTYLGTSSAMDYVSKVSIEGQEYSISMNNILKKDGYRFYQSSYDDDERGTILSVSYDPWGVTITYIGYLLLLLSLIGFFFCKETYFRQALSRVAKGGVVSVFMVFAGIINASAQTNPNQEETPFRDAVKEGSSSLRPKALPKELADSLCNLYVYYGGRIAPLQTLARDYVMKVYGKPKAMGYSAEEVFSGWMLWFDTWKNVPIKLKAKDRGTTKEDEKYFVMQSVASLKAIKVFPYKDDGGNGDLRWISSSDTLPFDMDESEWLFIRKVFSLVSEKANEGDYDGAMQIITKIGVYQRKVAGDVFPSKSKFNAEKVYNKIGRPMMPAMMCVTIGLVLFILTGVMISRRKTLGLLPRAITAILTGILAVYITDLLGLRWYVSGHVPMAGGFEMMLLIAWIALIVSTLVFNKLPIFQPLGLLLAGFALLVAVLGESNPQITPLMPVLSSPLLSIHVATMMISYTLLGIAALNGIMGVMVSEKDVKQNLADTGLVILYPGIFLLVVGTFLGAVWANVSWGSYWMWDPKETWALVTCLVYAAAFHKGSLGAFRNPNFFHWFCIVAFMCVLITYFGVNYILGGMHSYA